MLIYNTAIEIKKMFRKFDLILEQNEKFFPVDNKVINIMLKNCMQMGNFVKLFLSVIKYAKYKYFIN